MEAFNALNHATFSVGDQNIITSAPRSGPSHRPSIHRASWNWARTLILMPSLIDVLSTAKSTTSPSRISPACRTTGASAVPLQPGEVHGEYVAPNGASSASDALALGSHVGTHIDALCHFSCGGKFVWRG